MGGQDAIIVPIPTSPIPWTHVKLQKPSLLVSKEEQARTSNQEEPAQVEKTVMEYLNDTISRRMRRLWRDFYIKRNGKRPTTVRTMSHERTVWMVQEIYDARRQMDVMFMEPQREVIRGPMNMETLKNVYQENFLDFFYKFMLEKYIFEDVVLQVVYEFFTALQSYEQKDDVSPPMIMLLLLYEILIT